MIYINPTGGLGNMLFQIAALYVLAIENNDELCLLNIEKQINDLMNDVRSKIKHAEKYYYIFNKFKIINNISPIWRKNQQYSEANNNIKYPKMVSQLFSYKKLEYKKEHEYIGYFQSEKYFISKRNEILKLFKSTDEFNCEINKYFHLFNMIGLHVRRGDYVNQHTGRYIELTTEYYNKALSYLPKEMLVLVFSDDLNWCKENFIGDRFIFINEPDYITIYLMSKMKYFIIANSSFSWWGAWLGNAEKIFAPKEWFGNNIIHKSHEYDIIPNNWIKI